MVTHSIATGTRPPQRAIRDRPQIWRRRHDRSDRRMSSPCPTLRSALSSSPSPRSANGGPRAGHGAPIRL